MISPLETIANRVGHLWWTLVVVGVLWIVIGFLLLRFDESTVVVISIVFGVTVLLAAAGEVFRVIMTRGGWRVWHAIFAVALVAGAVLIFVNPGETFVSLAIVAGFYFVFAGTFDIISSLFATRVPGWWLQLVAGIAEVVLGYVASSSFTSSAVLLVTFLSVIAIFRGVSEISAGFSVRSLVAASES